jgi:hypothetical protein
MPSGSPPPAAPAARGQRGLPRGALPARALEHQPPERDDEPGLLGERDEVGRRHEPALRVVPAHERLDAHGAPRLELDDGLEDEAQLVAAGDRAGERVAQVALEREAGDGGRVHGRLEHRPPPLAARLGLVHRRVGVAEHGGHHVGGAVGGGRVGRAAARDADARPDEGVPPVDDERGAQRRDRPLGHRGGVGVLAHVLEEHGELVAAEPRDGVAAARGAEQARGHLDEQAVAVGVAERVVDRLEAVEVEDEHGDAPRVAVAAGAGERRGQPLAEAHAVGEPGERVVVRLPRELGLELGALGDVARVEHVAAHRRLAEQVAPHALDLPPAAVAVRHAVAERDRRGRVGGGGPQRAAQRRAGRRGA